MGDVEYFPEVAISFDNLVCQLNRLQPLSSCAFLDLLAVLVGPGQETNGAPLHPVVSRKGVSHHRRIDVADVRHVVDVVDRRRDVVGVFGHKLSRTPEWGVEG